MIRYARGDLLDDTSEALVNAVNEVGVMGKGIALAFRERFSENYEAYERACKYGLVRVGRVFVTSHQIGTGTRWIVNFPTKKHWRKPSQIEWVKDGLKDLVRWINEYEIQSVAIPALGCGLGGLPWLEVRAEIEEAFESLPEVDVTVYEPS